MIIGITGGIGCGKSVVLEILKEAGASIIDSDKLGHEALCESNVKKKLISSFGFDILDDNRNVDRKKLSFVFADKKRLEKLNSILHPIIIKKIQEKIEILQKKSGIIALEIPLLYECNLGYLSDVVCVVYADLETRKKRLEKRGLSNFEILERIKSQMPLEEKVVKADIVIMNNGTKNQLKTEIFEKILNNIE